MTRLQLIGIGSSVYRQLHENIIKAKAELANSMEIEEVMDLDEILKFPISSIPALAIEGKIIFEQNGHVPDVEEIKNLLNPFLKQKKK